MSDVHQERAEREGISRLEAKRRNWADGMTGPRLVRVTRAMLADAGLIPTPCPVCGDSPCSGSGAV